MTAVKKFTPVTIEEFIENYEGTRCQFHEGKIWEAHATTPDHSHLQLYIGRMLANYFGRGSGPGGGWWLFTEVAVKYGANNLFSHDLAGWRRARVPQRPKRYPVTEQPDWVCEILSTNGARDLVIKKKVLFEHEVPFYWIVNPIENILSVFEWSPKSYMSILDIDLGFTGKIPPFEAIDIKLAVLFGEEDEGELVQPTSPYVG
jgi:Uma2 family endonuclease